MGVCDSAYSLERMLDLLGGGVTASLGDHYHGEGKHHPSSHSSDSLPLVPPLRPLP